MKDVSKDIESACPIVIPFEITYNKKSHWLGSKRYSHNRIYFKSLVNLVLFGRGFGNILNILKDDRRLLFDCLNNAGHNHKVFKFL